MWGFIVKVLTPWIMFQPKLLQGMQIELGSQNATESSSEIHDNLDDFNGRGMPECYALSRQKLLEERYGCKLKFLYVRIGGHSIWPKGHLNFKIEPPTHSVWEILERRNTMTEVIKNADPMGIQASFDATKKAIAEAKVTSEVTQEGVDAPESAPVE